MTPSFFTFHNGLRGLDPLDRLDPNLGEDGVNVELTRESSHSPDLWTRHLLSDQWTFSGPNPLGETDPFLPGGPSPEMDRHTSRGRYPGHKRVTTLRSEFRVNVDKRRSRGKTRHVVLRATVDKRLQRPEGWTLSKPGWGSIREGLFPGRILTPVHPRP